VQTTHLGGFCRSPNHMEPSGRSVIAMRAEVASKKPRGRQRVFSDHELRRAAEFAYARRVRTRRGAQDLVYRRFAIVAIEVYRDAHPEAGAPLEWLLSPKPRYSLLSELGRVAEPKSGEEDRLQWSAREVNRLIQAALEIAEAKPTTKVGVAMIRDLRRRYRDDAAEPSAVPRLSIRPPKT
jgi:hypothetical protein